MTRGKGRGQGNRGRKSGRAKGSVGGRGSRSSSKGGSSTGRRGGQGNKGRGKPSKNTSVSIRGSSKAARTARRDARVKEKVGLHPTKTGKLTLNWSTRDIAKRLTNNKVAKALGLHGLAGNIPKGWKMNVNLKTGVKSKIGEPNYRATSANNPGGGITQADLDDYDFYNRYNPEGKTISDYEKLYAKQIAAGIPLSQAMKLNPANTLPYWALIDDTEVQTNTPEQVIKQPTENMSTAQLAASAVPLGISAINAINNKNKVKGKRPDFSLTGKSGIDWANQPIEGLQTFSPDEFVEKFGPGSGYKSDIPGLDASMERFKNVDWSNLDASSPYSGVTAQAMAQNELRKGGFDPYGGWDEPALGQTGPSLLENLTNKIRTGPEGLAAVQEQLKPQPTAPLKPFGGVTAQAAGQNELRKGGVDPYAGMGDPSNPNNQLLTEVTNQIRNTGSADGAEALVSEATGDPNNLLTAAKPYTPGGAADTTQVVSPPLGGDTASNPYPFPLPPDGGPISAKPATNPAGGGMTTQGGDTPATSNQSSGFGGSFDDFMKFMMMMSFMGGGMGGGRGGYGGSQYGYGGLNPGGVQRAYNPFEQVQSSWDWVNKNFGGSGSSPVTTNSTNI